MEAVAAELCVKLVIHLDLVDTITEGDCSNVVDSLNGLSRFHWSVMSIILRIVSLPELLWSCKYLYIFKSANCVAHNIAFRAVKSKPGLVYMFASHCRFG